MLLKQGRPTPAPTAFELEDIIKLADQVGSRAEVQYSVISDTADLASDVMHIVSDASMNVALKENIPAMASEPATVELTAGFPPTPGPTQVPTAGPTIPQGPMQKVEHQQVGDFSNYTECHFGCKGCETGSEDATCNIYTNDLSEACPEVVVYDVNTTYRESTDENGLPISDNMINYCNYMVREHCPAACADAVVLAMCSATCAENLRLFGTAEEQDKNGGGASHDAASHGKNVLQTWLNMHNLSRSIDSFTEQHCGWWYLPSSVCWCDNICYAGTFESIDPEYGCCALDSAKVGVIAAGFFMTFFLFFILGYQYYYRVYLPSIESRFLGRKFKPVQPLAISTIFCHTTPLSSNFHKWDHMVAKESTEIELKTIAPDSGQQVSNELGRWSEHASQRSSTTIILTTDDHSNLGLGAGENDSDEDVDPYDPIMGLVEREPQHEQL